jgi:hypothetical protein
LSRRRDTWIADVTSAPGIEVERGWIARAAAREDATATEREIHPPRPAQRDAVVLTPAIVSEAVK